MPCGVCPSEAFCTEASKPVPVFLGWKRKKEGRGAGGMGMQGLFSLSLSSLCFSLSSLSYLASRLP